MKASPLQNNFIGGEFSPLTQARVDSDLYRTGMEICLNYIPLIQGPITRRPGTYFVQKTKNSANANAVRLQRFEFSTTQAYIIEFGDQYVRFYRNNGPVETSPGVPYEISTPYGAAQVFQLQFTQSADTLYITHPSYAPRKLTRTAHTSWTLSLVNNQDGPYLTANVGATTLTPSGTTGAITITASTATWAATDVGRLVRIKHGTTWGNAIITGYTSTTVVNATVGNPFGATTAVTIWRLGLWSATTGYPSTCTFHEDRLFFAGNTSNPQRVDGSVSGDYENFAPTATDGVITAANALGFTLNSSDVNVIRWLSSDEKGLLVGTVAGEWVVKAASSLESMNATNIVAKKGSNYGSANIQPVQVGKSAIFVQRAGKKVRDMRYYYDVDGFRAADLTVISEHITQSGITQLAFQKEPQQIVWAVRNDGVLIGMSYDREFETVKIGWHRHTLGGITLPTTSASASIESVACIPSADGTRDELWMVVRRFINGVTTVTVEYMNKFFDQTDEARDAFFLDCGLTYDVPLGIAIINPTSPLDLFGPGTSLSVGDEILITNTGFPVLDNKVFKVKTKAGDNVTITDLHGVDVDGTAFPVANAGGTCRKMISTVSGLSHLNGEQVSIVTDGMVHPKKTVSGGSITLDYKAATVHVGLNYISDGKLLRAEAGSTDGTALGKTRRTHRCAFYLYRSLGLQIGVDFSKLEELVFRKTSDEYNFSPPLFTGIISENIPASYDFENQICWRQDQPLPSTILAIMPQLVTQDRG